MRRITTAFLTMLAVSLTSPAIAAPGGCIDMSNRRCANHAIDTLIDNGQEMAAYVLSKQYKGHEKDMPAITRAWLLFRWNIKCNAMWTGSGPGYINHAAKNFCASESNPGRCRSYYSTLATHYMSTMTKPMNFPCSGEGTRLLNWKELTE